MRREQAGIGGPDVYRGSVPPEPSAASDRLGWVGLHAARYSDELNAELDPPASTRHAIILCSRPPDEMEGRYGGVSRHRPPPAGSVAVLPAGLSCRWRWRGPRDSLHVDLEVGLVARVAAETFGLDPGRWSLPTLDFLILRPITAALQSIDAELSAADAGGPLAAESLANVLAVQLIRHVSGARDSARGRDGTLSRGRLRAVVDYIEGRLDCGPTLEQMAAVVGLSPYHFARQFKAATGMPPHRYVIARRAERAKGLLLAGTELSLAEVAARAGFTDQSQFTHHFKRIVGVTPGHFRRSAAERLH